MAGWGDNTFGYLKWGEFGDATVNVTNPNDTQWGKDSYGNFLWGGGGNLDAILADISITAEVNVGWSAKTWGYPEGGGWGNLFDVNQPLTGFNLTSTLGEETVAGEINTGYGRLTWGANGWGIAGTLQLSGIQMSANIGSVSIANEVNVGWGSDTWGYETWGTSGLIVDLTGIELTATLNSVTTKSDVNYFTVTGQEATITQNSVEAFASFVEEATGIGFDIDQGSANIQADANLTLSGIEMTMQEGDEQAYNRQGWGRYYWGLEEWGTSGEWEFVPVTGISMSMTLGSVVATPNTIASPTGILLSMQEGDEGTTANARVTPTGIGLTMTTGTVYNLIWNEVNTGTTSIWTEVDTAA